MKRFTFRVKIGDQYLEDCTNTGAIILTDRSKAQQFDDAHIANDCARIIAMLSEFRGVDIEVVYGPC